MKLYFKMKSPVQTLDSVEPPNLGCVRKWPSKAARQWSEEFVRTAPKQSNIDAIIAVGSAIRDVSEIADIDFIVVYRNPKPVFHKPPIDVDIRIYERTLVPKLLSKGHELLGWAVKMGRVVYERNQYWTKLRSRWLNRVPFPSLEEAKARAAKAEKLYREFSALGDQDAADEQFITMLTHLARARLIESGTFPASRPELEKQLLSIGEPELAQKLAKALTRRGKDTENQIAR